MFGSQESIDSTYNWKTATDFYKLYNFFSGTKQRNDKEIERKRDSHSLGCLGAPSVTVLWIWTKDQLANENWIVVIEVDCCGKSRV